MADTPMTDRTAPAAPLDHETIWLEAQCRDGYEGRQWCQDNVWDDDCGCDEGGHKPTKYVRADLAALAQPASDADWRTRFWQIVDGEGLLGLPSDEWNALSRLVQAFAAQKAQPAEAVERVNHAIYMGAVSAAMELRKERDALQAQLSALPVAPDGWRTMDSAPRDGTRIIAGWYGGAEPEIVRWDYSPVHHRSGELCWTDGYHHYCEPRGWQPLPAAPTTAAPPAQGEGK